ncbi:polyketide cyclase [Prauserella marina]|uniref:Polyketide cyclase / dehydrase and lipid transport n=1 Tax=Prauserella marina TaxID=530584 RepID=A0A222VXP5_9PSEU|nr:SRPBCC family protein [Prauserella marina]ASR38708.1 polyketide cyclase [Prauserella marina]PWV82050.1 polyketide cyclase/dehydrase/lipid transport protein [Prauserella marina]SDD18320.1 Polyketide cyclase / dehydrase and lipid transport [Prauserella marina]
MADKPNASGEIEVGASAETVYSLISDPGVLAELAGEYTGYRWLDGAREAREGARFRGHNRNGFRRWSTVSTITDAARGERFAFEVSAGPFAVSRWQYDIEPAEDGCRVVESTWDKRTSWFRVVTGPLIGVFDRDGLNTRNIAATLRRLKERAEA